MFNHRCNDDPCYRQGTEAQRSRGTDARSLSTDTSPGLSDSKIFLLTTTILPPFFYLVCAGPQFSHLQNGHGGLDGLKGLILHFRLWWINSSGDFWTQPGRISRDQFVSWECTLLLLRICHTHHGLNNNNKLTFLKLLACVRCCSKNTNYFNPHLSLN